MGGFSPGWPLLRSSTSMPSGCKLAPVWIWFHAGVSGDTEQEQVGSEGVKLAAFLMRGLLGESGPQQPRGNYSVLSTIGNTARVQIRPGGAESAGKSGSFAPQSCIFLVAIEYVGPWCS